MSKKILCLFVLGMGLSVSAEEVEIPLNIGIGPSLNLMNVDQPPSKQKWVQGAELDFYALITGAMIQKNIAKVPAKYRSFAKNTNELKIRPLWLNLIPRTLILGHDYKSKTQQNFGATWSFWGLGLTLFDASTIRASLSADLPSVGYLYTLDSNQKASHEWFVGASPKLDIQFPVSESFAWNLRYTHQVGIPLRNNPDKLTQIGVLSLLFNFRIPYKTRI